MAGFQKESDVLDRRWQEAREVRRSLRDSPMPNLEKVASAHSRRRDRCGTLYDIQVGKGLRVNDKSPGWPCERAKKSDMVRDLELG